MGLFSRKEQHAVMVPPAPPQVHVPQARTAAPVAEPSRSNWSDINAIRAEWPQGSLEANADMRRWHEGIRLYGNDDYGSMMKCAGWLSPALAHSLYGEGILRGADLPETAFKVLFAALSAPPDRQTFAETAQRSARLALTIVRENGWQPKAFGGTRSDYFEPLIMDKGNYMLLTTAIGPADRPWEGDLKAFFAVPPTQLTPDLPDAETARGDAVIDRMYETMQRANAGEELSDHHFTGMGLWMNGRPEEGLAELAKAAQLGSVQAMKDAGDLARELDRPDESRFWYESAANAGHGQAMFNLGVIAGNGEDFDTAAMWWQRAAEAGETDGFAALTQLADNRGDNAGERHWARLGAEAGHPFCIYRHGLYLAMDADGDVPTLRRARDFLETAADRGNVAAMGLAASTNYRLGDQARGRRYVQMVVDSGDAEEIDRLRRHGYLT